MIVVTGAAGFIGSAMVSKLNKEFYNDIIIVDRFDDAIKNKNLDNKQFTDKVDIDDFYNWFKNNHRFIEIVFHIGACSDTTEFNPDVFEKLNLGYTKQVWNLCVEYGLPLVYASSAATYGLGEIGYDDSHEVVPKLKPLNLYGKSKNDFDIWALKQDKKPFFWAGLKYFNVYGPNEYHKGRMASVVLHTFNQIQNTGKMKLFKSHNPDFEDGMQLRDFVYVKDVVDVMFYMMLRRKNSGIYNIGTGKARSFYDLAANTFKALGKTPQIEFIDMPIDIRDKYQYFTQADITKLRASGYNRLFTTLEDGINDYVHHYLIDNNYL